MDHKNNYIATTSDEFKSRELDAFGEESRFDDYNETKMFDDDWANNELIPFLRTAFGNRPGIGNDHDFWDDLRYAEFIEPAHIPNYPVADPIFIERLRLALVAPSTVQRPSLVTSVAEDMSLTIRLLIRRYVLHGGAFKLASLPATVRPELAEEVREAERVDRNITGIFAEMKYSFVGGVCGSFKA